MDLRRRITQALAGTGALLVVVGLSIGGGVAVAAPGAAIQPPADAAKATTTSSDPGSSDTASSDGRSSDRKSSDRKAAKGRRSRNGSGTDPSGSNGSADSTGTDPSSSSSGSNPSYDSTATSATTATTTSTTATTRPTTTTAPPPTATSTPPTTASTGPATAEPTPAEGNGQYNGGEPYQATEAPESESTSTTIPVGRAAKVPANRSGAGQPPEVRLFDPGDKPAGSPPGPAAQSVPVTPGAPLPAPVATAQSQPFQPNGGPAAAGGNSEPVTEPAPASEVSGAGSERREAGAARHGRQLGATGDGTRRLMLFGGVALLLGAVVVAFTGRERPALAVAAVPVGPARRPRPRPRKELDGWEEGVPLAPAKRELARNRLGIGADSRYGVSVESYYGDEPEA